MPRILVPLDGSRLAETVLAAVQRLFAAKAYALILLRVVPQAPGDGSPYAGWGPVGEWLDVLPTTQERVTQAQQYLDAVRARLHGAAQVRTHVGVGTPAQVIRDLVREEGVDMIAMATHGRAGLARTLLGSVTDVVLRSVPVPVLVVRSMGQDSRTVGIPPDRRLRPRLDDGGSGRDTQRRIHTVVPLSPRDRVAP